MTRNVARKWLLNLLNLQSLDMLTILEESVELSEQYQVGPRFIQALVTDVLVEMIQDGTVFTEVAKDCNPSAGDEFLYFVSF